MISPWLKSINLYAILALVALGGMIVTGIFRAGVKYERGNNAAELAAINTPIVEQRGKDEAEMAAAAKLAQQLDGVISGSFKQKLILDEETAKLLGSVN